MNRIQVSRWATLALALAPLVASAAGGAVEINQDCIAVGCFAGDDPGYPVTITHPGSYILTSDLAPPGSIFAHTIDVTAARVDIDLNGHTIEGGATCTGTPVTNCSGSAGNCAICLSNGGNPGVFQVHNGRIHGFGVGIQALDLATGSLFEHLTVSENNIGIFTNGSTVNDITHFRDVHLVRNVNAGVETNSGTTRYRVFVEDSTATGNGGNGLNLGAGSVVTGSRFTNNGLAGVDCVGFACALGQNSFQGNNGGAGNQFQVGAQGPLSANDDMGHNLCLDHTCP